MIREAIAVDIDTLATMPARGPWALRVLAGAMINRAADEVELTWPEAPPSVEVLARAVAGAGHEWRLFRPSGRRYDTEWALVLGPNEPCAQIAKSFVLAHGEDGFGYAVTWIRQDDESVSVHFLDFEDGSSRSQGSLETWCAGLVLHSLFGDVDGERNPDGIFLEQSARDWLVEFLRALGERRSERVNALRRTMAALELKIERIEAEGGDANAAYEELAAVSESLDLLGSRPPWPVT